MKGGVASSGLRFYSLNLNYFTEKGQKKKKKGNIFKFNFIELLVESIFSNLFLIFFYCKYFLQKLKTRVIKKDVNPEWNEDLTLSITDPSLPIKLVSLLITSSHINVVQKQKARRSFGTQLLVTNSFQSKDHPMFCTFPL